MVNFHSIIALEKHTVKLSEYWWHEKKTYLFEKNITEISYDLSRNAAQKMTFLFRNTTSAGGRTSQRNFKNLFTKNAFSWQMKVKSTKCRKAKWSCFFIFTGVTKKKGPTPEPLLESRGVVWVLYHFNTLISKLTKQWKVTNEAKLCCAE
jgi:hypothetical protein